MSLTTLAWIVPALCAGAVLCGLAVQLVRLQRWAARRRYQRPVAATLAVLAVFRLAVLFAAVASADALLAAALAWALPSPERLNGVLCRWTFEVLLGTIALSLWDSGPGYRLRRWILPAA